MERPIWRINCLGGLSATCGDQVIDRFQTQRTGVLLAYLAFYSNRRPTREEVIGILWPDAELDTGRNRLSQALAWLRSMLETPGTPKGSVLVADRLNVGLDPSAAVTDVSEFQACVKASEAATDASQQAILLAKACDLYQGHLLPNYYDDWVLTERQRLLEVYLRSLRRLIGLSERARDFDRAVEYAQRAIAADPLAEELHCELMRVLAASGQSVAALRHFQELERILAKELGLTPSASARTLADQIRRDDREAVTPEPPKRDPAPSIPAPLNSFFGREGEMARIRYLLDSGSARLITLTGVGGAGKTRLALEIASRAATHYPGLIIVVPLADLRDARLVPAAVADRLQLPRFGDSSVEDQIAAYLRQRQTLLVLDNLEHLVDGAATFIRQLLERVPSLTILATSQTRLGINGEREIPVPPLAAPRGHAQDSAPDELMQVNSVQLFVDRAQAVRPDFEIDARNAADIARICDRLEGIPLAIELCSAWVQALTPVQMLAQLDRRFDLLISRRTDSEPRHRSLRAAVEHSYHLLSPELQQFFTRLSVFRGGWTLPAAEAVMQVELDDHAIDSQVDPTASSPSAPLQARTLDLLMRLRDRSLIITEEIGPEMRYRMLDTLRDFAHQERSPGGDLALRLWHARYFLSVAEDAETHLVGAEQAVWLDRLNAEHDNLRSALAWSIGAGESEIALRLASALAQFWFNRGYLGEGQDWLERVAALPQAGVDLRRYRAKALGGWGMLARNQGHLPKVKAAQEEALQIWRELGDERGIAVTLQNLATYSYSVADWERAHACLEESMGLITRLGEPVLEARAFVNLGNLSVAESQWQRARTAYEEGLKRYQDVGDRIGMASALNNLGWLAIFEADISGAITYLNESLAIARAMSNQSGTAVSLLNLARVNRIVGCYDIARSLIQEGGAIAIEAGERRLFHETLSEAGHVACAEQKYVLGAALLAAGESLRTAMGVNAGPFGQQDLDAAKSLARSVLGDSAFEIAWAEGSALSFTQAFALATANQDVTAPPADHRQHMS